MKDFKLVIPRVDPCPHVTRLDLVRAALSSRAELQNLCLHVDDCAPRCPAMARYGR